MEPHDIREQLKHEGDEMKLVVIVAALKLAQHERCSEEFRLLGRHYSVESDPDAHEIIIRLLDPGGVLGAFCALLYSAFMVWM